MPLYEVTLNAGDLFPHADEAVAMAIDNIEDAPEGVRPTGFVLTGRVNPELAWRYCSAALLVDLTLTKARAVWPPFTEVSDEQQEWWDAFGRRICVDAQPVIDGLAFSSLFTREALTPLAEAKPRVGDNTPLLRSARLID